MSISDRLRAASARLRAWYTEDDRIRRERDMFSRHAQLWLQSYITRDSTRNTNPPMSEDATTSSQSSDSPVPFDPSADDLAHGRCAPDAIIFAVRQRGMSYDTACCYNWYDWYMSLPPTSVPSAFSRIANAASTLLIYCEGFGNINQDWDLLRWTSTRVGSLECFLRGEWCQRRSPSYIPRSYIELCRAVDEALWDVPMPRASEQWPVGTAAQGIAVMRAMGITDPPLVITGFNPPHRGPHVDNPAQDERQPDTENAP